MTLDELVSADLGLTVGAEFVAEVWDTSAWAVYAGVKRGDLPVAPLHLGRKLRWPTRSVLESVGVDLDDLNVLRAQRNGNGNGIKKS